MPPTVLQQLHTVVLGPGASTTIAHSLTDGNRPLVPNDVMPDRDTPIRVTAATTADVTYENTDGANAQTAVFRVQFDHTIQQATPTAGNPQLNRYYQGGGSGGGGAGATSNCLIFQPGGASTGPVIFNDWADLMAQLATLRAAANGGGCYQIMFDDTNVSPAVVPAAGSPHAMTDVEWVGRAPSGAAPAITGVAIADGASFTGLRNFRQNLLISFDGATPPISDFDDGDIVTMRDNVVIFSTDGGAPVFDLDNLDAGELVRFLMDDIAALGGGVDVTVEANIATTIVIFSMGSEAVIAEDALDIGVGVDLRFAYRNGSARVENQTAVTPTPTLDTTTRERWDLIGPLTGGAARSDGFDTLGRLYRCDPDTGDITINLPPSNAFSAGHPVTIKRIDTGAPNNVNVTPDGTDQIDSGGAGTPFVNSTSLSSNTFISDGAGGWDVI